MANRVTRRLTYTAMMVAVLWAGAALTALHILCDDTGVDW